MPVTSAFARFAPPLFVLLWASGFVVARLVRPHTEPESFLALRFGISALALAAIATASGARWPRKTRVVADNLLAGVLLQGLYLGGAFWAVDHGLPTALAALICSLQPLITAGLVGPLLGERVPPLGWIGIGIGFAGTTLVLAPNLAHGGSGNLPAVLACLVATISITFGTLWQKRIADAVDLLTGAAIQTSGAFLVTLPVALLKERGVDNHPAVWMGLAWSVLVMALGATLLLLAMIKRGAVAEVTALFYLVPAVTALLSFGFFGEALSLTQIFGMAVAIFGVFLVRHTPDRAPKPCRA